MLSLTAYDSTGNTSQITRISGKVHGMKHTCITANNWQRSYLLGAITLISFTSELRAFGILTPEKLHLDGIYQPLRKSHTVDGTRFSLQKQQIALRKEQLTI